MCHFKIKILGILLLTYVQVFQQFLMDKVGLTNVIQKYISFKKF